MDCPECKGKGEITNWGGGTDLSLLEKEKKRADKAEGELKEIKDGMGSDQPLSELLYDYHMGMNKAEERVDKLQTALDITSGALEGSQSVVRELLLAKQDIEGQLGILRSEYSKLEERVKEEETMSSAFHEEILELRICLKDSEAKNQIYLQDIRNEQKVSEELNAQIKELEGRLFDTLSTLEITLLEKNISYERVKELESQLASIKADPSIGKLEIVDGWNSEEEDIYTEQDGKRIEEDD